MSQEKVYLDNAATTKIDEDVFSVMIDSLRNDFGNPSSLHSLGRIAKAKIELVRKQIAKFLNASTSEIIFTSGGTESNNIAIRFALANLKPACIISTKIEHPSVLKTIELLANEAGIPVYYLSLNKDGQVAIEELEQLLMTNKNAFVSLMHGNNEIGNLLPLKQVAEKCKLYGAIFHTDTVQTIGHLKFDLQNDGIDFLSCSAHKIHGPKGVGFLYVNKRNQFKPFIHGGNQERSNRAGTENTAAILGMGKALQLAYENLEKNESHIKELKSYCKKLLKEKVSNVSFNGTESEDSMNTVLNVAFGNVKSPEMLIFQLDLKGVCVSGGSACSSGSLKGSHVLNEIKGVEKNSINLRFSFSRLNKKSDVDYAVSVLLECFV